MICSLPDLDCFPQSSGLGYLVDGLLRRGPGHPDQFVKLLHEQDFGVVQEAIRIDYLSQGRSEPRDRIVGHAQGCKNMSPKRPRLRAHATNRLGQRVGFLNRHVCVGYASAVKVHRLSFRPCKDPVYLFGVKVTVGLSARHQDRQRGENNAPQWLLPIFSFPAGRDSVMRGGAWLKCQAEDFLQKPGSVKDFAVRRYHGNDSISPEGAQRSSEVANGRDEQSGFTALKAHQGNWTGRQFTARILVIYVAEEIFQRFRRDSVLSSMLMRARNGSILATEREIADEDVRHLVCDFIPQIIIWDHVIGIVIRLWRPVLAGTNEICFGNWIRNLRSFAEQPVKKTHRVIPLENYRSAYMLDRKRKKKSRVRALGRHRPVTSPTSEDAA